MRNKRNVRILEAILGIVIFLCMTLRAYKPTMFISATTFVMYIFVIIFLFNDKLLLKYLNSLISTTFLLVGVFVCDCINVWLAEIDATTYYCGAFNIIAFYHWIFFFTLRRIDPYFEKHTKRNITKVAIGNASITKTVIKYGGVLVFAFNMGLFLSVVRHPFFIYGVTNRFEYAQTYISRWQNLIRVFPPIFAPLVLVPVIDNARIRIGNIIRKVIIPYVPYILFLIWTGNKYGTYVELMVFILVPLLVTNKFKIKTKAILGYGLLSISVILILLFLYYHLQGLSIASAAYQIYLRVACQGELWWKTIVTVETKGTNVNEFFKEISYQWQAIITEASVKEYGVYHLMNMFGRTSIVYQYSTIGTRYAASGMELPFYCFGYLALLRPILVGSITAWMNNMYINAVKENRVFTAIVSARIIMLFAPAFTQGDWYAFFSLVPSMFVCMLVFIELWNHVKRPVIFTNIRER